MSDTQYWSIESDTQNVCWLTLDVPDAGANTLSQGVLEELDSILSGLETELPSALIIASAKNSGFIAGADINEFPKMTDRATAIELINRGHGVLHRLAGLPCPKLAVLNGTTLGGGLELALCCDYRIIFSAPDRCVGLPEVQLGLHPGLGGTVRLLPLIGVRAAMDMLLTGRSLSAKECLSRGLVDKIINDKDWREVASNYVLSKPSRRSAGFIDKLLNTALLRPVLANVLRKQVAPKAHPEHYPAPYAIIDLWRKYGGNPKSGYQAEAESFADLLQTDTSKNLIRVFFLQDGLKHKPEVHLPDLNNAHVIGAGVMGGDIAAWFVLKGLHVTLQDRELKYIEPALARAEELFRKRLRADDLVADAMSRLRADVEGEGVSSADVIVEAIFENLEAKQALFKDLEQRAKPDVLLASNTSSIPLEQIAAALENPSRLVGLHFFNPVAKMPLIEVIRFAETDQQWVDKAVGVSRQIGKLPLICNSSPGFLVNRVLGPYLDEAMRLYVEGVTPQDIDAAAKSFGMPMGPVELSDSVGLDIALHVAEGLADITGREVPTKLREMVNAGQLGRKSGAGFYRYENGKTVREPVTAAARDPEIVERLSLSLLNESAACLHEQVVGSADEVDAGVIFGTGFAPFRGGPLHYGKSEGAKAVVQRLQKLEATYGPRFSASPGWQNIK